MIQYNRMFLPPAIERVIFYVLLILMIFCVIQCSDADPSARESTTSASGTSWNGGISAIFSKHCASCHPGSLATDYSTYAGVKSNIDDEMQRIRSGNMPPDGGMTDQEKQQLEDWVTAEMPEND